MASLPLKLELDLKYRPKIFFHFIFFLRWVGGEKEEMGVRKALNYACNFKKIKNNITGFSFSLYIISHISKWKVKY